MNKTQLIDFIANKADLSRAQAKNALEATLEAVQDALKDGDQVKVIGFGKFKKYYRVARIGRDSKTGEEIKIPAEFVPVFVASKMLKDVIRDITPSEPVKRLNPTLHTKRTLYTLSGNECAFPNCQSRMIDEFDKFIGEICHIEAAETGGQRFNPYSSNEDRRNISNLMLMCPNHHKITDNFQIYTVEKLKQIKRNHEEKVRGKQITVNLPQALIDYGFAESANYPKNLKMLGIDSRTQDNYTEFFDDALYYIKQIEKLPRSTREFFVRALCRSFIDDDSSLAFDPRELSAQLRCTSEEIFKHADILHRYGLLSELDNDEAPIKIRYWFTIFDCNDNQIYFLIDVKNKCNVKLLDDIFIELNFNQLESF